MRLTYCLWISLGALILAGCGKIEPVLAPPAEPAPAIEATTIPLAPPPVIPESEKPPVVLPPPPDLTPLGHAFLLSTGGHALILEFETGGQQGYNQRPEWPGGASGVTVGVGYDTGYYSHKVILADWQSLADYDRARLADCSGLTDGRAHERTKTLHDLVVRWDLAVDVFDRVDVAREFANAKRAMPGFEDLRANAQAAIISTGFNRGWSFAGPNRVEWRAIRDLVPIRDYEGIAAQERKMVRVWAGTSIESGMRRRRTAESNLVLTP
jgi:GH24 family phage-related lysozyme (muramidase)